MATVTPGLLIVGLIGEGADAKAAHYALTEDDKKVLQDPLIAGVILFARNFQSRTQIAQLVADIKALREPPLLVAVDHEGGTVQRFRQEGEFSTIVAMSTLGKLYDENPEEALRAAEHIGWLAASELLAVGIDMSFAPVLDVDAKTSEVIGLRAFHQNPEIIAHLAEYFIKGMHQAGMKAVGKHFPGHGHVVADSHLALPVDKRSLEDITGHDLCPYQHLIAHHRLDAVMTAHVVYEQVDKLAATFSSRWVQGILRQELDFKGVVFSDCILMHATDVMGTPVQRVPAALQAGCDMVLVCNDRAVVKALLADKKIREMCLARVERNVQCVTSLRGNQEQVSSWERLIASKDYQLAQDTLASLARF